MNTKEIFVSASSGTKRHFEQHQYLVFQMPFVNTSNFCIYTGDFSGNIQNYVYLYSFEWYNTKSRWILYFLSHANLCDIIKHFALNLLYLFLTVQIYKNSTQFWQIDNTIQNYTTILIHNNAYLINEITIFRKNLPEIGRKYQYIPES